MTVTAVDNRKTASTMLPVDVWRAARLRAAMDGQSLSTWLRRLVERELQTKGSRHP